MDRIQRKKPEFRRIAAMIMAVAMIISVIPFPEGLFHVTAAAAVKMSATWTYTDTMYDSSNNEVSELSGSIGILVNTNNDVLNVDASSGKMSNRKKLGYGSDFQINNGTVLTFPIIKGAKRCTITIQAFNELTTENITAAGLDNVTITPLSNNGWKKYEISGNVEKNTEEIKLTVGLDTYFQEMTVDSSTSLAVTSAGFAEGGDTTAEWTYSNGSVVASNSASSIQKTTGTYTNTDGDVLYVDASAGKFAPDTTQQYRIQINATTQMTIPAAGEKATLTLIINKNNISTDTQSVLTDKYLSLSGTGLLKAECTKNEVYLEDNNYRKVEITCYLDGDEGELTLTALSNTYFKSLAIACETLDKTTIKGSITSSAEIPDGTAIVATNQTTKLSYTGVITNGTYEIAVPAEDEEMTYELSVSDAEYQIASGVTTHVISKDKSADITANLKLVKLSTCVVTGSISGFADDYDISRLDVLFKAAGETEYVPEVTVDTKNKTYTAKLEKDMPYSVALQGVNDYELTAPAENVTYSEDSTLNMTVALKPTYQVSLTLPDTPDLSGKNITYTYINQDDGYTYIFSNKEAISLRDGTYLLQLSGDFLAQPYCVKSGLYVTVAGKKSCTDTYI
ncbi:MAG: hypothetical protein ACLU70_09075 [Lachnospira sp.]